MRKMLKMNAWLGAIAIVSLGMGLVACEDDPTPGPTADAGAETDTDPGDTTGDPCDPNPCQNGGTCAANAGAAVCTCINDYTGTNCETPPTPTDPCDPNPCQNNGTCADNNGTAECTCVDGFTGDTCQTPPPVDPCDPNPCGTQSPSCGADGVTYTTFQAGTCTDNNGTATCNYAIDVETACAAGEKCKTAVAGGCYTPVDVTGYTFDETYNSFITSLTIGAIDETVPDCGFDLDSAQAGGDPDKDNGLGALAKGLGNIIGQDINLKDIINEQIISGSLQIFFEWQDYDGSADDADITINGFYGEPTDLATWEADPDAAYADAVAGNGQFSVSPSSFDDADGTPLISFPATVTGGALAGGPAEFALVIPLAPGIELAVTVSQTQVAGTVDGAANGGPSITDGELGGGVYIEELVAALNAYIASSCSCLGLGDTPLITYINDTVKPTCATLDAGANTCGPDEDICGTVSSFCSAIFLVLAGDLDFDGNGETKYDALSVGVCMDASGAGLNGFVAAP